MHDNHWAIKLSLDSDSSIISHNTIVNNDLGVYTGKSYGNVIHHNNFINNAQQAYIGSFGYANWDDGYPSGGNYWSDHVCTGNPSDGSQSYIIDADNIDHYPFQHPNGWLLHQLTVMHACWSFLVLAITLTGYRRGEKWAWYTLWLVPAILVSSGLFNAIFFGDVNESLEFIPITSISLLGLLLPYRKFFPRKPQSGNV